jgi:hypothetical protein
VHARLDDARHREANDLAAIRKVQGAARIVTTTRGRWTDSMRLAILSIAAVAASLALVPSAGATYLISHDIANFHGREHFIAVGYRHAEAHCRPQTSKVERQGNLFHAWVCQFLATDRLTGTPCTGSILIQGSVSSYYQDVLSISGHCPHDNFKSSN